MKILCLTLALACSFSALSRSNNGRYYFSRQFKEKQKQREVKKKEELKYQIKTIIAK